MITNDGSGACGLADYFLIGHDLTLEEMYDCHLRFQNADSAPVVVGVDHHENTWIDGPAGFADLVRMEEGIMEPASGASTNAFLRNHFAGAADAGGGVDTSNTIFQSGGSKKSSFTAAKQVPRGRKIGYEFPVSFRDHLAKEESPLHYS